jgi:hypothetical protein
VCVGPTCCLRDLLQGDFVVAFLDIVGPELNRTYDSKSNAAPQLNHLLRQALLSCSGGVRLDEEANGPMQLMRIDVSKQAGKAGRWCCSARQVATRVRGERYIRTSSCLWGDGTPRIVCCRCFKQACR